MKNFLPLFLLSFFTLSLSAQDFTLLSSDAQGDQSVSNSLDAKAISIAFDQAQDSLWIKLETYDTLVFSKDWGFSIAFDTNEVISDGGSWSGDQNNSIGYERKLTFLNNAFFQPTFTSLMDGQNNALNQAIPFQIVDPFTLIIRLQLSEIDDDINMNILVGTGSFDDFIYDDMPDAVFLSTRSLVNVEDLTDGTNPLQVYPNPAKGHFWVAPLTSEIATIRLLSSQGQQLGMWTGNTSNPTRIDTKGIKAGLYFVVVEDRNAVQLHKVVVMNP